MRGTRRRKTVITVRTVFLGFLGGDEPVCGSNGEPLENSLVVAGTGDDVGDRVEEEVAGVDGAVVIGWGFVVAGTEVIEEEDDASENKVRLDVDDESDRIILVDNTKTADELDASKEYASSVKLEATTLSDALPSTPNALFHASAAC